MLPLEGTLVVAVEQAVSAPFCTSRLADAGARVIKIERPEGDFARGYDDVACGQSSYFVWLNRGKQSAVVDLATAEGCRLLGRLIARADVLVQNLRPGAMAKLGFNPAELRQAHPALICCSISGYGNDGPLADRKAYDLLVQAESGLSSITGASGEPARVGISVVDIAAGTTAHAAILEALIARSRTGQGADISVSMFDVMADWLTVPLLHTEAGRAPKNVGLAHPSIAPYGVFCDAEGSALLIAVQSDREWRTFCTHVLQSPALGEDRRFSTNIGRSRDRATLDAVVATRIAQIKRKELTSRLMGADIAFAELNDMSALSRHPHTRRIEVETPSGVVAYPPPGAVVRGRTQAFRPVPALGEHTAAIVHEFSQSADAG
jgi:formyl-CoA transferase